MSAPIIPDVPRTLRHLETDEQWQERSIESKLYCTASEAAHRLRGLADTLYGMGLNTGHRRNELSFLGAAAVDIAMALERVTKAQMATWEAADEQRARKAAKPRRKAAGRRTRA